MSKKLIESDEMLRVLCDLFLICIAERKKKAREVKDVCTCYCKEKRYVINSSREDHQGFIFDLDPITDTWKFFDCVICGSVICGSDCVCNTYYWLNGFDRVKVNQQNEISIRIDDYEYVSTKDDNSRKRDFLLLLVSILEELFKD